MKSINQQINRLKWTVAQEATYLNKTFKAQSTANLSNNQLSSFLGYLKSQEPTIAAVEVAPLTPPPLDRTLLNAEIESVMKRKAISTDKARAILQELFNARGRQQLSDKQLQEFLEYLRSSPVAAN
ncbi:hypothetical protein VF14_08755 [Nostoc linckia z18]|uniref:Uncharacterized protein n=2 Tax=Nostoc linckia TaxID=92942 RepID=A0A9Q5ZE78_NOSLI|nr:hypothetical protein [Nostoc linckia]PHK42538.1 hypothetical protein VF12_02400 [Nostoc linckia z15]PHK44512.1 hypothetical protein VF13_21100 [Nostoc linckia z16]PHJ59558.1 hypothetical protein VF02_24380 [Nostoc linckia z1]PHJ65165.1 hypothetical protein VF05_21770 [Nostoc linckia z3]PHJ69561.1 hypothetical protein VF03_23460 [Nostoc linckia z2]